MSLDKFARPEAHASAAPVIRTSRTSRITRSGRTAPTTLTTSTTGTAPQVFSALSWFNLLQRPLSLLPAAVTAIMDCQVTRNRNFTRQIHELTIAIQTRR